MFCTTGAHCRMSVAQKWAVQPVSTMAGVEAIMTGGPRAGTGTTLANSVLVLEVSCLPQLAGALGFPHPQVGLSRRRRVMTLLLPPCMSAAVALSLCPSALFLHRALVWLVPVRFVLALRTDVGFVLAEPMSPAAATKRTIGRWRSGSSTRMRSDGSSVSTRMGHNDRTVGAVTACGLGGELADALLVGSSKMFLEVGPGPVHLFLVTPLFGAVMRILLASKTPLVKRRAARSAVIVSWVATAKRWIS
jgi:hypothetical protein